MSNTYTSLHYHIVFSTKNREPWLRPDVCERVWAYLGGIARENQFTSLLVGGQEDHVHMLLSLPSTAAVSQAVQRLKGGSSAWIQNNIPGCKGFSWQDGYGAFTVSQSQTAEVLAHIRSQEAHHRMKSFAEEYRRLLTRHHLSFDERYL